MRGFFALAAVIAMIVCHAGCGPQPIATDPAKAAASSSVARPAQDAGASLPSQQSREPSQPARSFTSVQEAADVLAEATEAGDSDSRLSATKYLISQGSASLPELSERLTRADLPPRTAIAICRTLGQLGPAATQPLVKAMENSSPTVRLNAIEQLAIIKPSTTEIVDKLIELLESDDPQVCLAAVKGVGYLGKAAQRSSEKLQAIRNSTTIDDTIREAAGEALKKVDPRHTFVN